MAFGHKSGRTHVCLTVGNGGNLFMCLYFTGNYSNSLCCAAKAFGAILPLASWHNLQHGRFKAAWNWRKCSQSFWQHKGCLRCSLSCKCIQLVPMESWSMVAQLEASAMKSVHSIHNPFCMFTSKRMRFWGPLSSTKGHSNSSWTLGITVNSRIL